MLSMSPPAQNARPAPVMTTARTRVLPATRSTVSASSFDNSLDSALSFSGRFSVIVPMPSSSTSRRINRDHPPSRFSSPSCPSLPIPPVPAHPARPCPSRLSCPSRPSRPLFGSERELPHGAQIGFAGAERRNRVDPPQILALGHPQFRHRRDRQAIPQLLRRDGRIGVERHEPLAFGFVRRGRDDARVHFAEDRLNLFLDERTAARPASRRGHRARRPASPS